MKARMHAVLVWVAGGALLLATLIDTLAMLGRHVNLPLLGSIEVVQAAVLIASSGALVMATAFRKHARVHLLQRLNESVLRALDVVHGLASILVVLALLVGSAWITLDLWNGHEESELLRIPWLPLRLIVLLTLLSLLVVLLRHLFQRRHP
jgi:TRAP-type C4-dicarboxylate transport system permease small subunit